MRSARLVGVAGVADAVPAPSLSHTAAADRVVRMALSVSDFCGMTAYRALAAVSGLEAKERAQLRRILRHLPLYYACPSEQHQIEEMAT